MADCDPPVFDCLCRVFSYYPVKLGDFVHIGANTVTQAASIGMHVDVGKDCIIVSSCHSYRKMAL